MPRRSPSPSSPTLPMKQKRQCVRDMRCARKAAAMASIAAMPAPLSETPGPYKRLPCCRTFSGVPAGNTVSNVRAERDVTRVRSRDACRKHCRPRRCGPIPDRVRENCPPAMSPGAFAERRRGDARHLHLPLRELRLLGAKPGECGTNLGQRTKMAHFLLHARKKLRHFRLRARHGSVVGRQSPVVGQHRPCS